MAVKMSCIDYIQPIGMTSKQRKGVHDNGHCLRIYTISSALRYFTVEINSRDKFVEINSKTIAMSCSNSTLKNARKNRFIER